MSVETNSLVIKSHTDISNSLTVFQDVSFNKHLSVVDVSFQNLPTSSVLTPANDNQLATKKYVDDNAGGTTPPAPSFSAYQSINRNNYPQNFTYNVTVFGSSYFDGQYFTVPQSGLYHFNWSNYGTRYQSENQMDAQLRVNQANGGGYYTIHYLVENVQITAYVTSSFGNTARLLVGDVVSIRSIKGWSMLGNPSGKHPCWFSGFYISP